MLTSPLLLLEGVGVGELVLEGEGYAAAVALDETEGRTTERTLLL